MAALKESQGARTGPLCSWSLFASAASCTIHTRSIHGFCKNLDTMFYQHCLSLFKRRAVAFVVFVQCQKPLQQPPPMAWFRLWVKSCVMILEPSSFQVLLGQLSYEFGSCSSNPIIGPKRSKHRICGLEYLARAVELASFTRLCLPDQCRSKLSMGTEFRHRIADEAAPCGGSRSLGRAGRPPR
jgi:hypothetical protein